MMRVEIVGLNTFRAIVRLTHEETGENLVFSCTEEDDKQVYGLLQNMVRTAARHLGDKAMERELQ